MPDKNGILIVLSESGKTMFGKEAFAAQSGPQKVFSAIWALESEVNNGGFSQYFLNDSAETACFVIEALKTIGAPKTADICERAIDVGYPNGLPDLPEEISALAEDFSDDVDDQLGELDDEIFQYPHNLTDLLFAFVSKYPEEFGELPKADDA
jgi:hypothetical protein